MNISRSAYVVAVGNQPCSVSFDYSRGCRVAGAKLAHVKRSGAVHWVMQDSTRNNDTKAPCRGVEGDPDGATVPWDVIRIISIEL